MDNFRRGSLTGLGVDSDNHTELPAYSVQAVSGSASPVRDQIFPEPRAHGRTEHTFVLNDRKGKPWATLILNSSAQSPRKMPTFIDDEPVKGLVLLSLDRKESFTSVSISVGKILYVGTFI
jgi:hypothetical protein